MLSDKAAFLSFCKKEKLKQTFKRHRRDTKAEEAMEGKKTLWWVLSSPLSTPPSPKLSKKQVLSLTIRRKKGKKKKKVGWALCMGFVICSNGALLTLHFKQVPLWTLKPTHTHAFTFLSWGHIHLFTLHDDATSHWLHGNFIRKKMAATILWPWLIGPE